MLIYVNYCIKLKSGEVIVVAANQEIEMVAITNKAMIAKLNVPDEKGRNEAYYTISKKWGYTFNRYKGNIAAYYCVEQIDK